MRDIARFNAASITFVIARWLRSINAPTVFLLEQHSEPPDAPAFIDSLSFGALLADKALDTNNLYTKI